MNYFSSFLANASYMKLKRDCLIKAAQPTRIVKQLDRVVQSYKPISDHKHNVNNNSCLKLQLLFKIIYTLFLITERI
jgi:hypothetical protein